MTEVECEGLESLVKRVEELENGLLYATRRHTRDKDDACVCKACRLIYNDQCVRLGFKNGGSHARGE